MYPTSVVDDFLVLEHGQPGWEQVLDRHKVDLRAVGPVERR